MIQYSERDALADATAQVRQQAPACGTSRAMPCKNSFENRYMPARMAGAVCADDAGASAAGAE
jgi:hypothetical protein